MAQTDMSQNRRSQNARSKQVFSSKGSQRAEANFTKSRREEANRRDEADDEDMTDKSAAGKTSTFAQFDSAKQELAEQISDLASRVRALSPKKGTLSKAGNQIAQGLDSAQSFLTEQSTKDIATGAMRFVRNHPLPIALATVGAGLGLLIPRFLGSKASSAGSEMDQDSDATSSQSFQKTQDQNKYQKRRPN